DRWSARRCASRSRIRSATTRRSERSRSADVDRQLFDAGDEVRIAIRRSSVVDELDVLDARQDLLEHDAQLESRECRAEAEVRAVAAEREVRVRVALDV